MRKVYEEDGVEILEPDIPNTKFGVTTLIEEFHERLSEAAKKMTVADYIRLLQLQRELYNEEARDIEVTWIEPPMDKTKSDTDGPTGYDDHP